MDEGQTEAAQSIGMKRLQTMRLIVLPQAMRVIVPPTGNETISMLKTTSLVAVIAFPELLYSVQLIYSANYKVIPLLMVATIWYLTDVYPDRRSVLRGATLRAGATRDLRRPRSNGLKALFLRNATTFHAKPPVVDTTGTVAKDHR